MNGPQAQIARFRFQNAVRACQRFINPRIDAETTTESLWASEDDRWRNLRQRLENAVEQCKASCVFDAAMEQQVQSLDDQWRIVCDRRKVLPRKNAGTEPYRTGAPGRPTSRQLIEGEFDRRVAAGDLLSTLAAEAQHLERWLRSDHPGTPSMTAHTIENTIRDKYRRHRNPRI
jgi:hypothetical protein